MFDGVTLYRVDCVKGGDCINCLKCTEVCYRNNANVNLLGRDLDAKLTGSVAMATFLGVYGLTNFAGNAVTKSGIAAKSNAVSSNLNSQTESAPESSKLNHETTSSNTAQNNASKYKDGTYTGSGTGYKGGTTKISVTVSDGKISSIQAISNQDTPKFYQRAEGTIIKSIISKQSTSVDTVSGATYSSKGIMSAVTNALNEAK